MAKGVETRRSKELKKEHSRGQAKAGRIASKLQPERRPTPAGKVADEAKKPNTKGKSQLQNASTGVRGRTTHSLSSAGRKTTARTQGGVTKGSGSRHDY